MTIYVRIYYVPVCVLGLRIRAPDTLRTGDRPGRHWHQQALYVYYWRTCEKAVLARGRGWRTCAEGHY